MSPAELMQPREWYGSVIPPLPPERPLAPMALPQPASPKHPMSQADTQEAVDTTPWETMRSAVIYQLAQRGVLSHTAPKSRLTEPLAKEDQIG